MESDDVGYGCGAEGTVWVKHVNSEPRTSTRCRRSGGVRVPRRWHSLGVLATVPSRWHCPRSAWMRSNVSS
eukprot:8509218-Alexandrium_andersonii.AAC.1